ncbi:unnamed protein product, partial [Laminaria digitata]
LPEANLPWDGQQTRSAAAAATEPHSYPAAGLVSSGGGGPIGVVGGIGPSGSPGFTRSAATLPGHEPQADLSTLGVGVGGDGSGDGALAGYQVGDGKSMSIGPPSQQQRGWEQQALPQAAVRGGSGVSADTGGGRVWGALPEEASSLPSPWEARGSAEAQTKEHAAATAVAAAAAAAVVAPEEPPTESAAPLNAWQHGQPLLAHQRQKQ